MSISLRFMGQNRDREIRDPGDIAGDKSSTPKSKCRVARYRVERKGLENCDLVAGYSRVMNSSRFIKTRATMTQAAVS
jgi:hypothetical protein